MSGLIAKFKKKIEEFEKIDEEERIESRTIHNGNLKLYLDDKNRLRLYYKENELTKHCGFSAGILSDAIWYESIDSEFEVKKISPDEMRIRSKLHNLPMDQIWNIKITREGNIIWNVDIELKEPLRIDIKNVRIFLSKSYSQWISPLKQGEFSLEFDSHWHSVDLTNENCDFIGLVSSREEYPSIVLKTLDDRNVLLNVRNSDLSLSSRILEAQFEEEKELYQPGTYPYLKAIIQLYPDKSILEDILRKIREQQEQERKRQEEIRLREEEERLRKTQEQERNRRTIEKDYFRLYFDQRSHIHIYYKDNELTKGPGLHSGIFSEGNWYGSSDSEVEIERRSSDELSIYFVHNKLPLTQIWHLKLKPEGILTWDVNMHLKEPLRIDRRNASLFLSKVYKDWIAPPQQGRFPHHFNTQWQVMNSREDNPEFIGVLSSSEETPSIVLKNSIDSKALLMIQNTDLNLSSRILEAQFEEEKELYQPGTYPCLKAIIQLYPDKSILEDILRQIKLREEEIEKAHLQLKEDVKLIIPSEDYKSKLGRICIFGDSEELHDKISSQSGEFKRNIAKIRTGIKDKMEIRIGVSRFNFFRLNKIIQFCSLLMNHHLDLRSVSLSLFPVKRLYSNFIDYIKELNVRIGSNRIEFFLKDDSLLDLLYSVSSQADQYNEKDLLRLLGIITEHPFIGPQTVVLDTYHRCNTDCIHCWIHTPKRKLPPNIINLKMGISLYKKIIDDVAELLSDEIIIQGDGEPLLDSRFMEMIRYARDKGLKVLFFTNTIPLDAKKAKEIIELEIDEIFCSLPAGTDKTYAIINSKQSKDTFHRIVKNLKNLISMRNKLGKDKPWLQMSHVISNLNYHELAEMAKIDAYIGADKVRFYLARLDENIEFLKLEPPHIELMKKSLRRIAPYLKKQNIELQDNIYFQLENYNPNTGYWSENKFLKSGCPVGWFFCLILAKGELSLCCHLRIVDYLKEKSFKEVWNSERYNRFRIQAKYLIKNKDVTFLNGVKLYDEFCNHCDTHQVILMINKLLRKYDLHKFL